jgi:flagellar basal body-associated protein FliL
MIARDRKKSRWRMAVAAVVLALLACGVSIALAVRKIEVEKKIERKFSPNSALPKPTPKFPPLEPQPGDP